MTSDRAATSPPSARGSLLVVFLTVFIDLLGFGMVLPLLPIYAEYFAKQMTEAQLDLTVGLLMASFSAAQLLFAPIWGRLSDRLGRRPILLAGLVGSTSCYFLFGVATAAGSLAWMFVSRIGAGIFGATIPTAQAYIADVTTKETRARGMALVGAAFGLGFTFGPLLGAAALLIGPSGGELSPWPGYAAAALSAGALALAWFRLPESLHTGGGESQRHALDWHSLRRGTGASVWGLIFASFVSLMSFANFESTISRNIAHLLENAPNSESRESATAGRNDASSPLGAGANSPPAQKPSPPLDPTVPAVRAARGAQGRQRDRMVLLVFAYIGLVLSLAQGVLVRRLSTRIGEGTLAVGGCLTAILGFFLLAWASNAQSLTPIMAALAVEVTGFSLVMPSLNALVSRRTSPALQGSILGITQSAGSLARIVGPVVGNLLFGRGPGVPFLFAAGLMAVGLVLVLLAVRGGSDFVEPA